MSVDTVTLFLALLALTLQPAILGCAGALTRRRSRASVVALLAPYAPWSAAAIAVTCMLGSLYLTEVAHFVPCRLCWYQRIAM